MEGDRASTASCAPTRCCSPCSTVAATSSTSSSTSPRASSSTPAPVRRPLGHDPRDRDEQHARRACPRTSPDRSRVATTRSGTYVGIFAIDVPGVRERDHRSTTAPRSSPPAPTARRGSSRPTSRWRRARSGELVVRFTLPAGVRSMRIEPTARVPGVEWSDASGQLDRRRRAHRDLVIPGREPAWVDRLIGGVGTRGCTEASTRRGSRRRRPDRTRDRVRRNDMERSG